MNHGRLQQLFGVGPIGAVISFILLAAAVWANRLLGHSEMLQYRSLTGSSWRPTGLCRVGPSLLDNVRPPELVGQRSIMHKRSFPVVSSSDVCRLDHVRIPGHRRLF